MHIIRLVYLVHGMAWLSIALVIIEGENLAVAGYVFDFFIALGNYNLVKPIVLSITS